jgi:DNA-binding MarR family transcriptional regulator
VKTSDSEAAAQWELAKLVHALEIQNNARVRECVARLDLTVGQASALRELTHPMTMGELAARMGCEPSNATVVVDKLESLELIERHPHPSDRRAKQLTLTPDGSEHRERLLEALSKEPLFAGLTQPEQDALQHLLRRALSGTEPAVATR